MLNTILSDAFRDHLACGAVHREHVHVDPSDLGVEVASNRRACGHVGLHDVADYFDRIIILQNLGIFSGLRNYCIPLRKKVSIS